jgi:NADP-dependent 3-hydroxy acid dehydrogenase YdfG
MAPLSGIDTIWITGASSGIGAGLARRLARDGHRVGVTARRAEALAQLGTDLPAEARERLLILPADVTDDASLERAYVALKQAWGVPDLVLANAGVHQGRLGGHLEFANCRRVLDTGLLGAVRTLTQVLPDMLARGTGTLAAVASVAGYRGLPRAASYCAAKAGLIAFMESLRFDVERAGLRVVVINPGFVKTPMTDQNDFPMPFLISVDRAVDEIVKGLRRGRREIHFPKTFTRLLKLMRILPYPLYHALVSIATRRRTSPQSTKNTKGR